MEQTLHFRGTWRTYQQRILDSLALHLADNKIHIVAAPGAGKTTLGLEVIARLNRPALILVPTITIRAQWKQRLIASFLTSSQEDLVSTNIRKPRFITITTYQALLAAFCGKEEPLEKEEAEELLLEEEQEATYDFPRFNKEKADEIVQLLKEAHIDLLCFDEAHHLRNEWWKALMYLIDTLSPKQTISLTATPPYDADTTEWERYSSLCGSIDETISIPELVQHGDLCPHQDFIHFSLLRKEESEEIRKSLQRIASFMTHLLENRELIQAVQNYLAQATEETLLDEPKTSVALSSFLKKAGQPIPSSFLRLFFDFKEWLIPSFKEEYQKLFLSFILCKQDASFYQDNKELLEDLMAKAKAAGIFMNRAIYLGDSAKIKRQIANSLGKLDSIKEIVELEVEALGPKLRLVILADYIKYDVTDCSALGVIPIWQTLKERQDIILGVLTGTIILLPQTVLPEFEKRLAQEKLTEYVSLKTFERDEHYTKITISGNKKAAIVHLITQLFNEGHLTTIVGTQALLGEGWDAPSINSLILSSTVSSYMLSNQMRGRAIRIDKNNPDKVANIWHLASIKILSGWEQWKQQLPSASKTDFEPIFQLFDFMQLEQRFKGYEAPSLAAPYSIENGIDRILPSSLKMSWAVRPPEERDFISLNPFMMERAKSRTWTRELWDRGFVKAYNAPEKSLRTGVNATIKMTSFYYVGGYWLTVFSYSLLAFALSLPFLQMRLYPAVILFLIGLVIALAKPTYKFLRCSSPENIIRQIGIVVLETLAAMGQIKTSLQRVNIKCQKHPTGSVFFSVGNVSPEENNLIIKCMREIVDPIENPRYIFVRKGTLSHFVTLDYHSVPAIIGQKKKYIDIFKGLWEKYIGSCKIIYTRSYEGRRLLLKARRAAFSSLQRTSKSKKMSRYE